MNRTPLSLPEIELIAGTRAAFGAGVGLLLAPKLATPQRRAIGWTLFAIGVITTIPIIAEVFKTLRPMTTTPAASRKTSHGHASSNGHGHARRLAHKVH